jgi:hypothetical protein
MPEIFEPVQAVFERVSAQESDGGPAYEREVVHRDDLVLLPG